MPELPDVPPYAAPAVPPAGDAAWARARALVLAHGWNAMAYQLLNPGIRLWFAPEGDALVGWSGHGGWRVVAGAPVCAPDRLGAVARAFAADARAQGRRVCYFGAGERLERLWAGDGAHAFAPLGAQPWWDPAGWPARVAGTRSLRAQLHRARNKGVVVVEWPAAMATRHPALAAVLARWLGGRGLPPLHFLVEPDTLARLHDRRVFVARRSPTDPSGADDVVAFLVASPVPARGAWLLEQWPRRPDAPNGTVELLVDHAMRALGTAGARAVTMGLAPLAPRGAVDPRARPPRWLAPLAWWARAHGRRFYDFDGLEAFKAKFRPDAWEPIHLVVEGPRVPPSALWAVAGVFGGGSPLALAARALGHAVATEVRRGRKRARRPRSGAPRGDRPAA